MQALGGISIRKLLYPAQCITCGAEQGSDDALCAACWPQVPFIHGLACDACGTPLPGEEEGCVKCDDCLRDPPPWDRGRAAIAYEGKGRDIVLALKHADRHDIVPAAAAWMARAGQGLITDHSVILPVPLHWTRLFWRRYNQSALLAQAIGRVVNRPVWVDALQRSRRTAPLDGHNRDERFAALNGVIRLRDTYSAGLKGRDVVLVDDVMTSGATYSSCATPCHEAGANSVAVLSLARVGKGF